MEGNIISHKFLRCFSTFLTNIYFKYVNQMKEFKMAILREPVCPVNLDPGKQTLHV